MRDDDAPDNVPSRSGRPTPSPSSPASARASGRRTSGSGTLRRRSAVSRPADCLASPTWRVPSLGTARPAVRRAGHHRADGPDPHAGRARAPGARARLRPRRPPAARGRVRAGRRAAARERAASSAGPRSRRGLHGGSLPRALGGQGWTAMEHVVVHEQLGQVTGGLWSYIPGAYNVARSTATPTSAGATSTRRCAASAPAPTRSPRTAPARTPRTLAATAVRDPATGDYVLNGEKWFVTGPDDTDFMIFHCNVVDGDGAPADPLPRRLRHPGPPHQARPGLHPHVRRPAPPVRAGGRPRPGRRSSARSAPPTS